MTQVAADNTLVSVRNAAKMFGTMVALADVSFDLRAGEVLGVIGPSGGGKSTLLRCLDLLTPLDSGIIRYTLPDMEPVEVTAEGIRRGSNVVDPADVRRRLAFVFQHLHLWGDRTVLDNLTLAPRIVQGELRKEADRRAEELALQFGIRDKLGARVWELSGGQRQRVAIARALMQRPSLLLLDEITSALDPLLTADVMQVIRGLRERGITMVLVTHHIAFAERICDRILFLDGGHVLDIGPAHEVLHVAQDPSVYRFLQVLSEAR